MGMHSKYWKWLQKEKASSVHVHVETGLDALTELIMGQYESHNLTRFTVTGTKYHVIQICHTVELHLQTERSSEIKKRQSAYSPVTGA